MRNVRTRIASVLLVSTLAVFAGCGKKGDGDSKGVSNSTVATTSTTYDASVTDPTDFSKLDSQLDSVDNDLKQVDSAMSGTEGSIDG